MLNYGISFFSLLFLLGRRNKLFFDLFVCQDIVLSTIISAIGGLSQFGIPIWSKDIEHTSFNEDMSETIYASVLMINLTGSRKETWSLVYFVTVICCVVTQ